MSVEKRVKRLEQTAQKESEREWRDGLEHTLASYDGRRFLWLFLERCGVYSNAFSSDDRVTSFNCGMANAGQQVLSSLTEHFPEIYLQMIKENADVRRSIRERADAIRADADYGTDE